MLISLASSSCVLGPASERSFQFHILRVAWKFPVRFASSCSKHQHSPAELQRQTPSLTRVEASTQRVSVLLLYRAKTSAQMSDLQTEAPSSAAGYASIRGKTSFAPVDCRIEMVLPPQSTLTLRLPSVDL